MGSILVESMVNGKRYKGELTNVLHVPDVRQNLISVGMLTDKGFGSKGMTLSRNGVVIAIGDRAGQSPS